MSGINAGGVYSELVLDSSKFNAGIEAAGNKMTGMENKLNNMSGFLEKTGKSWTTKVTLPIVGAGVAATKLGLDFESAMSEVGAISGATGEDMTILENKARDLGATTKFSASEASEAFKYMAMAGWETGDMLEAVDGVMMLAAASGENLGLVSDIVTDSMTAFGLEAHQAGQFADLLASASSNSNTNVSMLGESFKYVAPLFGAMGYSAEDAALGLGLMANAGIKGSQSGTTLRGAITNLIKPTNAMAHEMDELEISVNDAQGELLPFGDLMLHLRDKFGRLTDEQKANSAATIFGKEAMSGMLAIINSSDEDFAKLTDATRNYTGAAKDMSDMMNDNLKGRWQEFKSAMEEAALQIYDLLLPSLERWLEKGKELIDWFTSLDKETQETILKIAGFAAAIGPVLLVTGKLAGGIGSVVGLMGKLSGAATVAGGASTAMGGGLGIAGGAAKASALLFNPWVLGAVAVGVSAVAIGKHLMEDTVPAFEMFDDTISESTKEALGNFMELEKQATIHLNQLAWSGMEVTEEMKESITSNTNQMADEVILKLEEQKTEGLKHLKEMLDNSIDMSEEEKEEAIRIATEKYDAEIEKATEGKAIIEEILQTALENNTKITDDERIEIESILEDLKDNSISLMTESQEEQENILNKLKENADRITLEMASEVIKNSVEQKEKTIEEAEEQYKEVVKMAELMKKDGTKESKDLADNMIKEADRQKKDTIKKAEEMHKGVVSEIKKQGGDIIDQLDTDNGNIRTKWDDLKDWFNRNPIVRWIKTQEESGPSNAPNRMNTGRNAHGTNHWRGGLTWVGEQGPELIELEKGSKVHTNKDSMDIAGIDEGKLAAAIIKGLKDEGLSKPANIILDGKAVGRGIVKIMDSELSNNNQKNNIGKGVLI